MQLKATQRPINSKGAELVKAICDYIKENQASRITLALLGEHFGTSPYHLQRTFVKVMGISPRRYQEECPAQCLKGSTISRGTCSLRTAKNGIQFPKLALWRLETQTGNDSVYVQKRRIRDPVDVFTWSLPSWKTPGCRNESWDLFS